MTLYAPSQIDKTSIHTRRRLRLPMIFGRELGIDTVDLVFDLSSNQAHQLGDLRAVEISWVGKSDLDFSADAAGVRVENNDAIRQPNRLADRMGHEKDCL